MSEILPAGILPLGSVVRVDGRVLQVCAVDTRRGYRVSDRAWGGRTDRWVPHSALTAALSRPSTDAEEPTDG